MNQAQVLGSRPGHGWSLPLSFISLGVGTAWQAISQGGKARMQVVVFLQDCLFCFGVNPHQLFQQTTVAHSAEHGLLTCLKF